jgi:DNA-binding MarR family transcriptional regulator
MSPERSPERSPEEPGHPLADVDRVIHGHARLMVMSSLFVLVEADYTFLLNLTGLTWGNLSSHLTRLEEAGYVEVEKKVQGRRVSSVVRLTPSGRKEFKTYRDQMKSVLDDLPE